MTDEVIAVFDAHADDYDALRRRLVPPFERFYGAVLDALTLVDGPIERVLDLGAGTGLLSTRVAAAHPAAQLTLLDGASAMLAHARRALGERAAIRVGDLGDALPDGPFDAVVSALAIHHLPHDAKRDLYARAAQALRPGGVLVNADQIAGATPRLERAYWQWHEQACYALGATREEWADAVTRMSLDIRAPLADQLQWLTDAGLHDVDCLMKDHGFAVFSGYRA